RPAARRTATLPAAIGRDSARLAVGVGAARARPFAYTLGPPMDARRSNVSRCHAHRSTRRSDARQPAAAGRPDRSAVSFRRGRGDPAALRRAKGGARDMMHPFSELVIGGVFLAPFVTYAVASLALVLAFRPLLRIVRLSEVFSHPSIAALSLYVVILG